MEDIALLQEYARTASEPAFAALVERHVGLVYSAARRQVRDPHLAEDVTQAVFVILARKAEHVSRHPGLSGWLLLATLYAANAHIRAAIRRTRREQEAIMQSQLNESSPAVWTQLEPLLDEALASLGKTDRAVLALRYFENQTAAEIGRTLNLNEEAAKKRANRALEKLRKFFTKRGVTLSSAAIAGTISANSVQAAPIALAKSVTAVAMTKGVAASGSSLTLIKGALKIMAWQKIKTAITVGLAVLLVAGTTTLLAQRQIQANASSPTAAPGSAVIPYKTLDDQCQFAASIDQTKFAFNVLVGSRNKTVHPADIHLTIHSKAKGEIPLQLGEKGQVLDFPHDEALRRENPPIVSDQPKGTLGLGIWFWVPMPENLSFQYDRLVESVAEVNKAVVNANKLIKTGAYPREMSFNHSVRGVVFIFDKSSARKAKVSIESKKSPKEYVAGANGVLRLELNKSLAAENPTVRLSEKPQDVVPDFLP